jgi:hypothetical protein
MGKILKSGAGAAVVALGLYAGVAQAVFINGSISLTDGGLTVPGVPSTSIVSQLNTVTQGTPTANACSGAFSTGGGGACDQSPPLTASTFVISGPYGGTIYTYGPWTFTLLNVTDVVRDNLACNVNGLCNDTLDLVVSGVVSGAGFDDTTFAGAWTANGACAGNAGPPAMCTTSVSASWSVSLVALGTPVQTPEPATLALIGVALAGLGFARRRT